VTRRRVCPIVEQRSLNRGRCRTGNVRPDAWQPIGHRRTQRLQVLIDQDTMFANAIEKRGIDPIGGGALDCVRGDVLRNHMAERVRMSQAMDDDESATV
jgi:hypothetical protein